MPPLSHLLAALAADTRREHITLGDLMGHLSDRALAALLLVFALPNVLPAVPGLSAILGAPLLLLSAQLALGRRPWLPPWLAARSMRREHFSRLVSRAGPWLGRAERLLRPRLGLLARPPAEHLLGAVCVLLALVVFLPIPMGNMLPAAAICLLALGLLERDGLWVLAGLATGVVAVVLVSGVAYAMLRSALYLLANAF